MPNEIAGETAIKAFNGVIYFTGFVMNSALNSLNVSGSFGFASSLYVT